MDREVIGNLVAQVSLDGTNFQKGVSKLNRQLKVVKSEFNVTKEALKDFGNKTDYLKAKSDSLSNELTLHRGIVKKLEQAYNEAKESSGEFSAKTQRLATKLNKAKTSMIKTEKQLGNVNREIKEQNRLLDKQGFLWGKNFGKMKNAIKDASGELDGLQRAMGGIAIASGVAIGTAVFQAANFEQALANVKAVSGATSEQMEKLSEIALDLGAKTKYSGRQVLEGAEELIKAGLSMDQVYTELEGTLNLATAGEIELADAAAIASNVLNTFKDDNISVARAGDILAGSANASATSVSEMSQGLSQVSAVAASAGLSFEDTATALSVLANNGLKGSDAGTSLKTMLLQLTPTTKKAKDSFKELGIITEDGVNQFYNAKGELKDFSEVVGILNEAMDDLNPKQRAVYLKEMFGTDAYRAGAIFFKEAASGIEDMNKAINKITAAEVAAEKMDTLIGKVTELKSALETLGINVGTRFLPVLTDIVKELTSLTRGLGDINPEMLAIGLKATGAAAGFGVMSTGVLKLGRALMFMAGNPVGLAITGLSALVGIVVGVKEAYDEMNRVSFDHVKKLKSEVDATDDMINKFTLLKAQNQLSNDEMLRFLDIQAELAQTAAPAKIAELKDEQAKLLEKSTLTTEEMKEFVSINDDIIKQSPNTEKAISAQGEAYALNVAAIKEMNKEKLRTLEIEAEREMDKALDQLTEKQKKLNDLQAELVDLDKKMSNNEQTRIDLIREIQDKKEAVKQLEEDIENVTGMQNARMREKLESSRIELDTLKAKLRREEGLEDKYQVQFVKKQDLLDVTRKEVKELENAKFEYEKLILSEIDLTSKRGEGLTTIKDQIQNLEIQKNTIKNLWENQSISTTEYREQNKQIDNQLNKLDDAYRKLKSINEQAGKEVFKTVKISTYPKDFIDTLNKELSLPIKKAIQLYGEDSIPSYDVGTDFHGGGLAYLHKDELVNLPRGSQVFTKSETKSILNQAKAMQSSTISQIPNQTSNVTVSISGNNIQFKTEADMDLFVNKLSRDIQRSERELGVKS